MTNPAAPDQMAPNQTPATPASGGKYQESLPKNDTEPDNANGNPEETELYKKAKELVASLEKPPSILGLPHGIAEVCLKELCYPMNGPENTQFPVMNLVELQRLNIYALRKKLADKAIHIVENKSLSDGDSRLIEGLMADYCERLSYSLNSCKASELPYTNRRQVTPSETSTTCSKKSVTMLDATHFT
jgi:hypothetical protein